MWGTMIRPGNTALVKTIKEKCRICYTCVRECPAKAIRIADGQAEVLSERCVGCGNCVRVCSQRAKQVLDSIPAVQGLFRGSAPVAAVIAPSFPAEFGEIPWKTFVGMVRALRFRFVNEVAFGADLIAERYTRLLEETSERYIATTCPAVIAYVEHYHPDLVSHLAPIVSPMIAVARALRYLHGSRLKIVFVGPCVAKKGEAASVNLNREVDAVLTFVELRRMFEESGIIPGAVTPSDFDVPHGGAGSLFPVNRGLLEAAQIKDTIVDSQVLAVDGRTGFVQAIREFESGDLDVRLLEVLACNGCIMGPGLSNEASQFHRRSRVSRFVREKMTSFDRGRWRTEMRRLTDLDLSRVFTVDDQRIAVPHGGKIEKILAQLGKQTPADELNCGACGYDTCREHAAAILRGLAESDMCLPQTIEKLHRSIRELATSHRELATTQEALMNSERLASMGQLAAGIAHEVNNPLGVVLMYSHLLLDSHGKNEEIGDDLKLIAEQADRCKKIVAGLLNFARKNKVLRQPVDIGDLVDRVFQALPAPEGIAITIDRACADPIAELDRDQMTQVLTNLVTNSYDAMPKGGTVTVRTTGTENEVSFAVIDTGAGIPEANLSKIFEPFFTTKQMGKGTGLGLAVTYGIVKMHNGSIEVASNADSAKGPTGATFTVTIPRKAPSP
jgi:signal transduction histidine kinase/iron only hydrogenase large subunit-like protein